MFALQVFLSGDPAVEVAALTALKSMVAAIATGVTQVTRSK